MSIPVSNVQYVDQLTVVKSDFLQPVNDVLNYQLGLVGASNAGLFAFGTGYALNDYTVYNTGMYLNIVPVVTAFVTPDMDPTHWMLLRSVAQLAAALAATTGASLIGTSSGATVESMLANFSFASIALLRAAPAPALPAGMTKVTTVAAFYVGSLTGGGDFRWQGNDSRADDGGTIIRPTGYAGTGRWNRFFSGAYYANWFGVREDGSTDDTAAMYLAMAKFTNGRTAVSNGQLILTGFVNMYKPLIYGGSPGSSFELIGIAGLGRGGSALSGINFLGTSYPSSVIFYGANNSAIRDVTLISSRSADCINSLHVTADNHINTTLSAAVTAGTNVVVTPVAMGAIAVGAALGIDAGGPLFEIVYVTAITATTFTATFAISHASGVLVGGSSGSSECRFHDLFIGTAQNYGIGILVGNYTLGGNPQVDTMRFVGTGFSSVNGDSGMKFVGGGNVKNMTIDYTRVLGFNYAFNITAGSGPCTINSVTAGFIGIADILANGGQLTVNAYESESNGCRFLVGDQGNNPSTALITGCSWESAAPADDIVIDYNGALTLISNNFNNTRTATSSPIIRSADLLSGSTPSSITSIGNWYQNAKDSTAVFYQSNNPLRYGAYPETLKSGFRLYSFNDFGGPRGGLIPLTPMQGPIFNIGHGFTSDNASTNITYKTMGQSNGVYSKVTIPYTAFQNASLVGDLISGFIENASLSKITDAYVQVTTPFVGTAGTLLLRIGSLGFGTNNLILDSSVASVATYGLVDSDLGAGLARATAIQGGIAAIARTSISVRLTSSAGNLSNLTAGSVDVFIGIKKMN